MRVLAFRKRLSIKMDERRVMILALNKRKYDAAGKVKENREF